MVSQLRTVTGSYFVPTLLLWKDLSNVNRPRVFCDWCDQPIQDARDGNVYWFQNDQTILYFNHKRCARAHEEHLRDSSGVGLPLSEDLDTFFSYLLVNVGMEAI